jgi:hypothetical protein
MWIILSESALQVKEDEVRLVEKSSDDNGPLIVFKNTVGASIAYVRGENAEKMEAMYNRVMQAFIENRLGVSLADIEKGVPVAEDVPVEVKVEE